MDLIGVCFDGSGRAEGQAGAPRAMREAGLAAVLRSANLTPDIIAPEPTQTRGDTAGLLNELALLHMIDAVYTRVRETLGSARFPFIYGADCSVLLGAIPALRDARGRAGLVFIDGHEDATPIEISKSGEAANMEIALLLGLTASRKPLLRSPLPALASDAITMLGQRDDLYRAEVGASSIADRVRIHGLEEVRQHPADIARQAAAHVAREAPCWWLHIDLDVLDRTHFSACGAAADASMPGGLTWSELRILTASALESDGCSGWSICVYNADLDPDRQAAGQVVRFVEGVTATWSDS